MALYVLTVKALVSLPSPEDPTWEADEGRPEASREPEGKKRHSRGSLNSPGAPLFSCALWLSGLAGLLWPSKACG